MGSLEGMAHCRSALGEHEVALSLATQLIRAAPDRSAGYLVAGIAHQGRGSLESALSVLSEGIAHASSEASIYIRRAMVLEELERYEQTAEEEPPPRPKIVLADIDVGEHPAPVDRELATRLLASARAKLSLRHEVIDREALVRTLEKKVLRMADLFDAAEVDRENLLSAELLHAYRDCGSRRRPARRSPGSTRA